nr:hypothetical protein [Tanacetum cinerariifolium]
MMSLGVGKIKDEVVYTLAGQPTEVASMADVLRYATLLSLIYVGVLSLPTQRRSSRLWQWDQVKVVQSGDKTDIYQFVTIPTWKQMKKVGPLGHGSGFMCQKDCLTSSPPS